MISKYTIVEGVIIEAAGGAGAGIIIFLLQLFGAYIHDLRDKRRLFNWLRENTSDEPGKRYRSTRAIASWNNLTENRVRYICSIEKRIHYSTGEKEDLLGSSGSRIVVLSWH